MDYKEEYELGSIVTATRTFNGETITGEFGGFHLLNKSNPKSIVGVVHTPNGSYDVEPNSIESVISEDEKIRKELIEFVNQYGDKFYGQIAKASAIAWLEKQGEQKPTDKVEPKFKTGDWVIYECGEYSATLQIENIVDGTYEFTDNSTLNVVDENTLRLWTIQDAKYGDVLTWDDSKCIALFKEIYNKESFKSYGCIGACTDVFDKWGFHDIENAHPATKEQRDLLFQKMKEAGYGWDADKKELKKIEQKTTDEIKPKFKVGDKIIERDFDECYDGIIKEIKNGKYFFENGDCFDIKEQDLWQLIEQKPAWSEEDEEMFDAIIEDVMPYGECPDYPTDEEREYFYEGNRKVNWLKALKEKMKGE